MPNPRDVTLDLVAHDKTERPTKSAADNLDKLKRKVDEVDRANRSLGERARIHIRKMTDSMVHSAKVISSAGPLAAVTAIAVAIGALPSIATVAGIGIVAGLGGGLAALGIAVAAKNKEVKASFADLKDDVGKNLKTMAAPFKPVMLAISDDMREAWRSLRPELRKALKDLAPIIEKFSDDVFDALEKLEPVLDPVVDGFRVLARELGAGMPGLLEDVATAFTEIAEAIEDNPQAIRDLIGGLGDLIAQTGQVIAWLIRMNAHIDSSEAGFDTLMHGATASMARIVTATTDMAADVLEALARIPGFGGIAFTTLARSAREAANLAQQGLDTINTRKAQADIRSAEARLRVLGNMKPTPEVKAEIAELKRKVKEAKAQLKSIRDEEVIIRARTIRVGNRLGGRGSTAAQGGSPSSAGGVGFALTAPGGTYRTGGPAMPDVYATTYVTLDGREIAAAVKTVISEATGRQAFRARSGRR